MVDDLERIPLELANNKCFSLQILALLNLVLDSAFEYNNRTEQSKRLSNSSRVFLLRARGFLVRNRLFVVLGYIRLQNASKQFPLQKFM